MTVTLENVHIEADTFAAMQIYYKGKRYSVPYQHIESARRMTTIGKSTVVIDKAWAVKEGLA
jgi:hypothetical protein